MSYILRYTRSVKNSTALYHELVQLLIPCDQNREFPHPVNAQRCCCVLRVGRSLSCKLFAVLPNCCHCGTQVRRAIPPHLIVSPVLSIGSQYAINCVTCTQSAQRLLHPAPYALSALCTQRLLQPAIVLPPFPPSPPSRQCVCDSGFGGNLCELGPDPACVAAPYAGPEFVSTVRADWFLGDNIVLDVVVPYQEDVLETRILYAETGLATILVISIIGRTCSRHITITTTTTIIIIIIIFLILIIIFILTPASTTPMPPPSATTPPRMPTLCGQ